MSRLKVWSREAGAYVRLGVRSAAWWSVRSKQKHRVQRGVLFVPGVGAVGSHFGAFRRHLAADWFGAFEYGSWRSLESTAKELAEVIRDTTNHCDEVVLVGHSLGGLLSRMVLQDPKPPGHVAGWVSLCAPLHGTWRARWAPSPGLRSLRPDSAVMTQLLQQAHRLERYEGRILTLGAEHDLMLKPQDTVRLGKHPHLEFPGVGHNAVLLDPQVHRAVREFIEDLPKLDVPGRPSSEWI